MKNFIFSLGKKAKIALNYKINNKIKNKVLLKYATLINQSSKKIIKENNKDIKFALKKVKKTNLIDRLKIDQKKINSIIKSIKDVAKLKDPVNVVLDKWKRPNGLIIKRVSIPIGVIGVIFESRPNVASDISILSFKSGNAVILRGGSEALNTNKILISLFRKALKINKVNPDFVQFIEKKNRKYVDLML